MNGTVEAKPRAVEVKFAGHPKYMQVAEHIRRQVRSGALRPGDRLPSFPEMRSHGVSQNTMERAHAILEREDLIVREKGRGVFIAKPRRRAPRCIGLALASSEEPHPYRDRLRAGAEAEAHRQGLDVRLLNSFQADKVTEVDGVLIMQLHDYAVKQLPEELPAILLLGWHERVPSVVAADYDGIRLAVRHLVRLGHERIAYLAVSTDLEATRLRAYRDELNGAGINPDPAWLRLVDYDKALKFVNSGRASMKSWLAEGFTGLGCTALLVQNDETAIGVMDVLAHAGLRVPGDISVIGFDGTELCDYTSPCLTSITVPLREIGAAGVRLLLSRIAGEKPAQVTEMPVSFKPGASTAPPATPQGRSV